jgi:hypothetical protein
MKQLEGLNQKDIIPKVTGKITKLWEKREKEGNYGPYTIQSGEIEIDGALYGLTFWDCPQNPELLKGKDVTISSTKGKNGLGGVELGHESYTSKDGSKVDRDTISVKKQAKVALAGEAQQGAPANPPASTQTTTFSQVVQMAKDPVEAIEGIISLHLMTNDLVRSAYKKKEYDEETLRSYVSSIFIEANRKGIAILPKKDEPAELDTKNWGCAIVPSGSNKGKKLGEIGKPALTKLYEYYLAKGFDTPFAKCVEQAGIDFQLGADPDDLENQPEIPW